MIIFNQSPLTANLHNGGYFGGYQLTQECGNRKARMSRIIGGSNIRPGNKILYLYT